MEITLVQNFQGVRDRRGVRNNQKRHWWFGKFMGAVPLGPFVSGWYSKLEICYLTTVL